MGHEAVILTLAISGVYALLATKIKNLTNEIEVLNHRLNITDKRVEVMTETIIGLRDRVANGDEK